MTPAERKSARTWCENLNDTQEGYEYQAKLVKALDALDARDALLREAAEYLYAIEDHTGRISPDYKGRKRGYIWAEIRAVLGEKP